MGISIERNGIVGCQELVDLIVTDMLAGGFTQVFPTPLPYAPTSDSHAILEAGPTVDPLQASQPWRISIKALNDFAVQLNVATDVQLTDTGVIPTLVKVTQDGAPDTIGRLGKSANVQGNLVFQQWIHRNYDPAGTGVGLVTVENNASYPMSYRLTTSAHGFVLYVWDEATDGSGNKFSWICVQRSVDSTTGQPYVSGKAPVYCAYSSPLSGLQKFIVREADINKPTVSVDASVNTEDSRAIINAENQVAITEDNRYIITFPNGLNTPRCAYTHELDLIGTTSADVISQWAEVPLTVYGEATPRKYKAMNANRANNTGMRLMMLMQGPSTTPQ